LSVFGNFLTFFFHGISMFGAVWGRLRGSVRGRLGSDVLENELPRKLRRKLAGGDVDAAGSELTLTMREVRELVQCALELQEQRLRVEYDDVLTQQLREQFESFTRFNREHLSRVINERDFSYCG
jgi:hypothetical protein